jgi:hypothetical protein
MASGGGGGNPEGQLHLRFVPTSLVNPGLLDPYALGPPGSGSVIILDGSGSFHQQAKNVRKTGTFKKY